MAHKAHRQRAEALQYQSASGQLPCGAVTLPAAHMQPGAPGFVKFSPVLAELGPATPALGAATLDVGATARVVGAAALDAGAAACVGCVALDVAAARRASVAPLPGGAWISGKRDQPGWQAHS
jgi:hypothetical protein